MGALLLLLPGCVTRGAHEEAIGGLNAEIARVERESTARERSIEALGNERDGLLEEIEGLRAEREQLEAQQLGLEAEVAERDRRLSDLHGTYDGLVSDLESELATGQIQISQLREGIRLDLSQEVLFPLGSARLGTKGRGLLKTVAGRLTGGTHRVEVRGHTDALQIHGALADRFPTNWELAGARAAGVVRVLQEAGVPPELLVAASRGQHQPAASNDTAKGRARNRRIEIWLRPLASAGSPSAGEDATPPAAE